VGSPFFCGFWLFPGVSFFYFWHFCVFLDWGFDFSVVLVVFFLFLRCNSWDLRVLGFVFTLFWGVFEPGIFLVRKCF
jgi:hypothetical protein